MVVTLSEWWLIVLNDGERALISQRSFSLPRYKVHTGFDNIQEYHVLRYRLTK